MSDSRALLPFALAISSIAGIACAAAQQAAVEIGPPRALAGPPEAPDEAVEKPRALGPGCSWTGDGVSSREESLPLCFAADGACFATVASPFSGPVTLTLPAGKPADTGARVEIVADLGIRLDVWTAGDEPLLFPRRPLVFGSVLVPSGGPGLHVERVRARTVDLAFRGDPAFKPRRGLPVRAACKDVGLRSEYWSSEETLAAAGILGSGQSEKVLPTDQPVGLSSTPGGSVIADIAVPDADSARVDLIEQRGPWSRVLWWQDSVGLVFGWVDSAALSPAPPRPPAVRPGPGSGWGFRLGPPPLPGTRCPIDVALFAEVAGTRGEVGVIVKGTRFDAGRASSTDLTVVRLRARDLDLMPDSRWLVRTASLDGCVVE